MEVVGPKTSVIENSLVGLKSSRDDIEQNQWNWGEITEFI